MDGRKRLVTALNVAAYRLGVRKHMPLTQAKALIDGLVVREAELEADEDALEKLAVWMVQHYSPLCAMDRPDGLIIDTTGSDHLFGGEQKLVDHLIGKLTASGIVARVAIANTWGAAYAFARYVANPTFIAPADGGADMLAKLPLPALRLPRGIVETLNTLGFDRIGEIASQPRAPLALRFGSEIGRRLDQAYGRVFEPIDGVISPDLIEVTRAFAEPISAAETIARYIGILTTQLCDRLDRTALGARRLDLVCHRVDNRVEYVTVGMAKPVRDVKRLTKLLCDKIEKIDPGFGIEKMSLSAPMTQPLVPKQVLSSLVEEAKADTSGLFDNLANRFGASRFHRMAPIATDVPERSIKSIPADEPLKDLDWQTKWRRPFQLLAKPEPIQVVALLPDHPPVSITWRGSRHRIKCADGPERIRGEWWRYEKELGTVRDYFHVEDETGENYWIFRTGDGERLSTGEQTWFMHGIFA